MSAQRVQRPVPFASLYFSGRNSLITTPSSMQTSAGPQMAPRGRDSDKPRVVIKQESQVDTNATMSTMNNLQTPKNNTCLTGTLSASKSGQSSHVLSDQVRAISKAVLELEHKEERAQAKRKALEKENAELVAEIVRLNDKINKERVEHQAKCRDLEAASDAISKELEEEKNKSAALKLENEDLTARLSTINDKNKSLAENLEEKSWESYIYRCATNVAWRSIPSLLERTTYKGLVWDVIRILNEKKRKEMEDRANREAQENNEGLPTPQPATNDRPEDAPKESSVHNYDSKDESLAASVKRRTMVNTIYPRKHKNHDERDDSDDEKPLMDDLLRRETRRPTAVPFPRQSFHRSYKKESMLDGEI